MRVYNKGNIYERYISISTKISIVCNKHFFNYKNLLTNLSQPVLPQYFPHVFF